MNADSLDATTLTVAVAVLDHLDTMYPAALQAVPGAARVSLRNTIRSEVRRAILSDREQQKEEAKTKCLVPLTVRQRHGLDFIKAYIAEHRLAPSYDEIGRGLGMKGKGDVFRLVHSLQDRGHVRLTQNRARAIEVLG